AIADSGWAVLFWRLLRRERLTRISGLALFKALLEIADTRIPGNLFFILPSEKAKSKTFEFGWVSGYPITDADCYVAPRYFSCSHGSVSRGERERVSQKRRLQHRRRRPGRNSPIPSTETHPHFHFRK